ncbi:uncharacterized protein CDAR_595441 [Caerostris darwini]|uniref:Odorant receptor n=1 Tax=Caerostris darwini TaxID=1538125 RepID=A0AAV4SGN1_9ARAC|nr:uncharacterized protein CDAR_595441 [Caerostris darwini]
MLRYTPMGAVCSAFLTDVFSVTIRMALIHKRHAIFSAITYLQDVHTQFGVLKCVRYRTCIATGIVASCIIPLSLFWYTVTMCLPGSEKVLKFYTAHTFLGWSSDNKWNNCFLFVISDHLVVNQQYLLSGFLLVLSCYILGLLKQTVASFTSVNHHENDLRLFFTAYLRYSETVSKGVSLVNRALSLLLLFLYGFMTFSIFSVTTFLLTSDFTYVLTEMLATQIILMLMMILGFYTTSFQAVAVHDAAKRVKNLVYDVVSRSESSDHETRCLLLMMAAEFPSEVVVTGWGMFSLKRSFLQKTTSGMFTYAILLSQVGNQTPPK